MSRDMQESTWTLRPALPQIGFILAFCLSLWTPDPLAW